jgi:hypothetical protein
VSLAWRSQGRPLWRKVETLKRRALKNKVGKVGDRQFGSVIGALSGDADRGRWRRTRADRTALTAGVRNRRRLLIGLAAAKPVQIRTDEIPKIISERGRLTPAR